MISHTPTTLAVGLEHFRSSPLKSLVSGDYRQLCRRCFRRLVGSLKRRGRVPRRIPCVFCPVEILPTKPHQRGSAYEVPHSWFLRRKGLWKTASAFLRASRSRCRVRNFFDKVSANLFQSLFILPTAGNLVSPFTPVLINTISSRHPTGRSVA